LSSLPPLSREPLDGDCGFRRFNTQPRDVLSSHRAGELTGSDVVAIRQSNCCKTSDYVGQASRRYRDLEQFSPQTDRRGDIHFTRFDWRAGCR
jgi:hypothetical protein